MKSQQMKKTKVKLEISDKIRCGSEQHVRAIALRVQWIAKGREGQVWARCWLD